MPTQETIHYQAAIDMLRVEAAVTREIHAPSEHIFPLACPVEELRWIPDWEYELVYSQSGVNETDGIFVENKSGLLLFEKPIPTTWVTLLHDPDNKVILFLLNLSGKAVIRLDLRLHAVGPKTSRISFKMLFTALDREANAMSPVSIREKLELVLIMLADSLKHYCETGKMI